MNPDSERALLEEIQNDPSKFSIVFDKLYSPVFGYIFRRIGDYDAARDIASETFLKAFLNIGTFHWKGIPLSFWMYRIATNEMQQYFRKKKYVPRSLDSMVDGKNWDITDFNTTHEEKLRMEKELQHHEDFFVIQQKIRQLPVNYQEVLTLRYFEEKSIREIAAILGKNEGTVKSLLSRGLEKLRNIL